MHAYSSFNGSGGGDVDGDLPEPVTSQNISITRTRRYSKLVKAYQS